MASPAASVPVSVQQRACGAMLGLACGDALGTTVEFCRPGSFAPVTEMTGGGPFGLLPGQWTDDTSMALCLADSLLDCQRFDAADQMTRYLQWLEQGYRSATGACFDIGRTTLQALMRFKADGNPWAGSTDVLSAGNGSLMRLAPVVLWTWPDRHAAIHWAQQGSRTTHGATEAVESCALLADLLWLALEGVPEPEWWSNLACSLTAPRVQELASGRFRGKPREGIRGSGYCVESLEAACWCVAHGGQFEDQVLRAVNLGDDADTTAAIAGQLAGALHGEAGIPARWRQMIWGADEMIAMATRLIEARDQAMHDD